MTPNGSAYSEVAALKQKVKEIIGQVNALKAQLQRREISLEDFKTKKAAFENELRSMLDLISQYKVKATKAPPPPPIEEPPVLVEEKKEVLPAVEVQPVAKPAVEVHQVGKSAAEVQREAALADEVQKDAYIADEVKRLMYEFQTEFTAQIAKPRVYISASVVDHYIFEVDLSDYPLRPHLKTPQNCQRLFDVPFENYLPILKNWDPAHPPHIVEIFYEIEGVFLKIFQPQPDPDPSLNMVRIQKILKRRELLAQIEFELETKNDAKAIELYKEVIQLSYALEEFERAKKYTQIRAELKKTLGINE